MHQYLPAIGFSKIKKRELENLLQEITLRPDYQESAIDFEGNQFVELRYMVADNVGLVLRGIYNEDDEFILDYYYPTYFGESISSKNDVEVIKQSDKDNYLVMCDEIRLGVNLIFQLQNMGEFLRNNIMAGKSGDRTIRLAALSLDAKIILPLYDNEKSRIKEKMNNKKRIDLFEQAREGNEEALESLTMDEIDLYQRISRRVTREDILSVVTSYFMPFGIENDKYDILGDILDVKSLVNHLTMEELYVMIIESNDVVFEVCINKKNLFGEPAVGRRFKGTIWLQGTVDFS
ncbi:MULTISPECIES: DUF3881 family protein [Pseudobutyrivibrio]|uniref:DUF3881 family protein n=1 Tax=Pseudobutyrivibrio TaxID=46205 RepID=UPI000882B065|nr:MULTISPECIES: DUF3881 family protein [Pseudobutyrivibrio]MBR5952050.1 DUF3881 family protein [Pseudobutyrivibrio sp.]SCY11483.1 protein of unknown function [Pseudobutyrivibrio sp. AR14]